MVTCIKLKFPGLDERDVQLTRRHYVNITAATRTTTIRINITTINTNMLL